MSDPFEPRGEPTTREERSRGRAVVPTVAGVIGAALGGYLFATAIRGSSGC